ncbi:hypothetical protein OG689_04235 [Kitasatospora sp. NBC_00240]|uniref:hypothetical protein n=1 Tax=Kitasatospora sp. NBC_00240 TaxID=2903567 RepID=UPI00225C34B8|nr:hypothetical protein [Kitasatospora sp. NBC_00240]MCX5208510.1 hypothetical protein [Kitasatospora sp. NBC_00240]
MTQQQTNGSSPIDAAGRYLEGLGERLRVDGCHVSTAGWRGRPVVVGSRSDRKARWFGTKTELFVLAAAVPEIDAASLRDFTGWAMDFAKSIRSGLPGARNAATVLPALVSGSVQPSAAQWAAADARLLGTTLLGRPITVETVPPGAARTIMYRGGVAWGGMFTGHVLEKASLYFP